MEWSVLTRKTFLLQSSALLYHALPADAQNASRHLFPMGVWYEGGVGALRQNLIPEDPNKAAPLYQRNFADIAAHGLNAVVVTNTPPAHHKTLLDAAEGAGIKVICEVDFQGGEPNDMIRGKIPMSPEQAARFFRSRLSLLMKHPAFWRVQLLDEPQPAAFKRYAQMVQVLRQVSPTALPFTCLRSGYDVGEFLAETHCDVAAFDLYPFMKDTPVGAEEPLKLFEEHATSAGLAGARHNADVWAVMQGHGVIEPKVEGVRYLRRFPTLAELRCMTYLALASGCRGLWWFLYQTEMHPFGVATMAGLVDREYRASDRWEEVKKLTAEIRLLAPTLQTLRPVNTFNYPLSSSSGHVLQDAKGQQFLFTVNRNTLSAAEVSLNFPCEARAQAYTVTRFGEKAIVPSHWRDRGLHWSESLPPGAGALYRIN